MYRVYTLTDGELLVDEEFKDSSSAHAYYRATIDAELAHKERETSKGRAYEETTVHLFDGHESAMSPIAEYCITHNGGAR